MGQMGFFDIANRYAGLDAKNDPLVKIDRLFRGIRRLEAAWRKPDEDRKFRTKPWDALVNNLSDDQVEYQLRDRLSFSGFWGWGLRTGFPMPRRCGSTANTWRRRG